MDKGSSESSSDERADEASERSMLERSDPPNSDAESSEASRSEPAAELFLIFLSSAPLATCLRLYVRGREEAAYFRQT